MIPPSSTSSSEDAARGVRAWQLALLVIALVEVATASLAPVQAPIAQEARFYPGNRAPTFSESVVQWQVDRIPAIEKPAELLVSGDSSALMGLIPRYLKKTTGLESQNIGTVSPLGIDGHLLVLEHYLANHPPPKVVVYQFVSLALSRQQVAEEGVIGSLRIWLGRDDALVKLWPTHRLRVGTRAALGLQWHVEDRTDSGVSDFLRKHDGFLRETEKQQSVAEMKPLQVPLHRDSAEGLLRLMKLGAERGFQVAIVHAPMPQAFGTPQARQAHVVNQQVVTRLAAQFPHVRVMRPFGQYAPDKFFARYEHLTLEGARIHTELVARWLKKHGFR